MRYNIYYIGKVDDELGVAIDHKGFIMDLSKLLSSAAKKGKHGKKVEVQDSDTDFFITKPGEDKPDEEEERFDKHESEVSITQLDDREELPMDKAMLHDLMVLLGIYLCFHLV